MYTADFKKSILDNLNAVLKPLRFKRNQNIFTFSNNDLTYYICVQNTVELADDTLKLTVNIEIASSKLSYLDDLSIPGYLHRHFLKNIGEYSTTQQKKWWTITDENSANKAETEITNLIIDKVLPEIEALKTTNDLAKLWQKQITPGLTHYQSQEYLSLLRVAR